MMVVKRALCILTAILLVFGIFPAFTLTAQAAELSLDDLEWNYRAFGQSTDLRFHNSASIPAQDGINNVWINPSWVDDPDLMDATPVLGQSSPNNIPNPDAQLGKSGAHISLFTKSSLFIPSLEGALEADTPVKLSGADKIVLESRGGKITTGHDGMTYLYTALPTDRLYKLTADITKSSIGSHPAAGSNAISNQTGAGIMARDFVAGNRQVPYLDGFEEVPACSNFVGAGLWTNNNNSRPGQAYRIGVTSPFHAVGNSTNRGAAGGNSTTNPNSNSAIGLTFTYSLERANDGFYYTVTKTAAEGGAVVVPRTKIPNSTPDMLQVIDEDQMYWGFCASREIRILVENVALEDLGEASFTPTPPAVTDMNPNAAVVMRSRNKTTRETAVLALRANHDGTLKVTSGSAGGPVVFEGPVTGYNEAYIDVSLELGANSFYYDFVTPNPDVSVKTATGSVTVTRSPAVGTTDLEVIWAAPAAKGDGSGSDRDNAMAVSGATSVVEPGQTIYLIDEAYTAISIGNNNSGSPDNYVTIMPEPGVNQVRARNVTASSGSSYIHIKGILAGGDDANSRYNGNVFTMGQSDYMIVENCTAQWSTGSGFTHNSGGGNRGTWAKYNTYLNCTATHNEDAALQNSDGFQMQGFGVGNKYIGCVASYSGDDGWDHFLRVGEGPGGDIYYENCIAYGHPANGFKLGGEGQPTPMELVNCLAYDNGMAGFSDNFNPGHVKLVGCIAIDNNTQNFIMRDNPNVTPQQELIDCISFRSVAPTNFFVDAVAGTATNSALILDDSQKSYLDGEELTSDMFASLDRTQVYTREADGTLVRGTFGQYAPEDYTDGKVRLKLSGPSAVTVEDDGAEYILSAANLNKLATATLWFEVDGKYFEGKGVNGLSGFSALHDIVWENTGGTLWTGRVTLANLEGGVTSEGYIDLFKLTLGIKEELGGSEVKLTRVELSGYNEDNVAVFFESVIRNGAVSTDVVEHFSPYDVNRDGKIDQLDLTTAQLYYAAKSGDSDWDEAKIADVNGDGRVDIEDFILILNNIVW